MAAVRQGNYPLQGRGPSQPPIDEQNVIGQDGALKVAAVTPSGTTPGNDRRTRNGKFTLAQLRQTDGIVPLQSGTNQFDSQRGKTGFGMPRNTSTKIVFADDGKKYGVEELTQKDNLIRLQSGTNKFDSQKGMTGFGMPRDVKGKHLKRIWELEFPEEELNDRPINAQTPNQVQYQNAPQYQQQQQFKQPQGQFQQQGQYQQGPISPQSYQQGPLSPQQGQQRFTPQQSPRGPPPPQQFQQRQPPHIRQ